MNEIFRKALALLGYRSKGARLQFRPAEFAYHKLEKLAAERRQNGEDVSENNLANELLTMKIIELYENDAKKYLDEKGGIYE